MDPVPSWATPSSQQCSAPACRCTLMSWNVRELFCTEAERLAILFHILVVLVHVPAPCTSIPLGVCDSHDTEAVALAVPSHPVQQEGMRQPLAPLRHDLAYVPSRRSGNDE